jgi:hypothetical protein
VGALSVGLCSYIFVRAKMWEFMWVFFFDDYLALYNILSHFAFKHLRLPVGGRKIYYREIKRLGCARGNYFVMEVDGGTGGGRVLVQCADDKSAETLLKQVRKYVPSATALDAPSG